MPGVETTSQVLKSLGARAQKAWNSAKKEETEYSKFAQLPPIEGGVAQLVQLRFGVFQNGPLKGKRFFDGEGVIHTPKEVPDENGVMVKVQGKHTRIAPIPLCDTPDRKGQKTTLEQHFGSMCNEIRKLMGVETFDDSMEIEDLAALISQLNQEKPFFKFNVRKGRVSKEFPNPRSFESWEGLYNTAQNGEVTNFDPGAGTEDESGSTDVGSGTTPDMNDLADLIMKAEEGDDEAISALQSLAHNIGIDDATITDIPTWAALGEKIVEMSGREEPEMAEDDRLTAPDKGDVFYYFPVDAKTKKPASKFVQIEVDSVDLKAAKIAGHNLTNPKLKYKDVPFDQLYKDEPKLR